MTDQELADALVALGILKRYPDEKDWWIYAIADGEPGGMIARKAVRDWRVAGAVMELLLKKQDFRMSAQFLDSNTVAVLIVGESEGQDKSLPRAICEAGVEALNND